jgi:hypothetical protein
MKRMLLAQCMLLVCLLGTGTSGVLGASDESGAQASPSRQKQLTLLQRRIAGSTSDAEKLELEHTVAWLWLGQGCNDPSDTKRFCREVERIFGEYPSMSRHFFVLDLKVTYAQLMPRDRSEAMLWEVISCDPAEIQPPEGRQHADAVNRLKQGAIWAYLNDRIADATTAEPAVQKQRAREETARLSERLKQSDEGRRCIPLANWWRDTISAEKPRSVRAPVLAALPPSKWDRVSQKTESVTRPTEEASVASPEPLAPPKDIRLQQTFDKVECLGTVAPANTSNGKHGEVPHASSLPWVLGSIGLVVLGAGLVQLKRNPPPVKPSPAQRTTGMG